MKETHARQKGNWRKLCLQVTDAVMKNISAIRQYCSFNSRMSQALLEAVKHPGAVKWRSVAYYLDVCGSDAMPIIALLGFLIGVILAFQAIIQLGRFGVESYVINLVGSVIVTELAPLVTAVVLAGRTGSAFAAELGTMKVNEELDAMTTFGIDLGRFLLLPKLLAMLLATPGLTIIADVCGILGGMMIVCSMLHFSLAEYIGRTCEIIQPVDLLQGMAKSVAFGAIVALVGCMKGLNAPRDAGGVGSSTTSAVVGAIFLIVVIDAVLTALFGLMAG